MKTERTYGIGCALAAALLFGASTPLAKLFVETSSPFLIAGLLYLGSGLGLGAWTVYQFLTSARVNRETSLNGKDWGWFLGSVFFGGLLAPVLLMLGLQSTVAAGAALLLNLEAVATALIAWIFFKENVDRKVFWGFVLIVAGGVLLSLPSSRGSMNLNWGALAIMAACLGWGIDNNLTRKISASNPVQIAMLKGLIAGSVNTSIALFLGAKLPATPQLALVGLVGFLGYGLSLALFVLALRHLGAARTGAYFSTAPFAGAILALAIWRTDLSFSLVLAGIFMGGGVWLHLTEHHEHEHLHEEMDHEHLHVHDEHHQHEHAPGVPLVEPHSHPHHHARLSHKHRHDPDIHHRHSH